MAVIITQNSKIKSSLFVASSGGYECEKAIDDNGKTGEFLILNLFYFIQVIIFSFFKRGLAPVMRVIRIGFNLISIGEF